MSKESKVMGIILLVVVGIMVGLFALFNKNTDTSSDISTKADSSKLVTAASHKTGSGSKVTVVEFGDYQCPACGAVYPVTKQVIDNYKDKITFVFRNYPLPMHPNAVPAAYAAEAAAKQDKFWEMHDKLYETQSEWSELGSPTDKFVGYAKDLGLNVDTFKTDMASQAVKDIVKNDQADGDAVKVSATPTIYINSVQLQNFSYDDFKTAIDADLK